MLALIDGNGTVVNLAVEPVRNGKPDPEWAPGPGLTAVATPAADGSRAEVGGAWDGTAFVPPVRPIPPDPADVTTWTPRERALARLAAQAAIGKPNPTDAEVSAVVREVM